jgi:hypothetical protein
MDPAQQAPPTTPLKKAKKPRGRPKQIIKTEIKIIPGPITLTFQ